MMRFEFKLRLMIISIVFSFVLIMSTSCYLLIDNYLLHKKMNTLMKDNLDIINENLSSINDTKENLRKINTYIKNPEFPDKISQLNKMKKYIDINDEEEIKKVVKILKATPLDPVTSSVVVSYSKKLDIPISLLLALIEQESNFKQYEVGKDMDRGYCQLIPSTEKWLADTYGHLLGIKYNPDKIYDPEYNIGLGALYLYILKDAYGNNYHKILSEYNRGIYNLKKYYQAHGTYVTSYSRGVLSRETKYKELNY